MRTASGLLADSQMDESRAQGRKIGFDNALHQAVVHISVTVNQDITESDDASKFGNRGGGVGIDAPQLIDRLGDDLKYFASPAA